jgi:hypothetical protein
MLSQKTYPLGMALGPSLIFDKSSLESLNLDEAVLMDNFYMSTMTRYSSSNALLISKRASGAIAPRNNLLGLWPIERQRPNLMRTSTICRFWKAN